MILRALLIAAVMAWAAPALALDAGNCPIAIPISQATSTDLYTSHNRIHVCAVALVNGATAQSVSLVEGTGSICATNKTALIGGTTASVALAVSGFFGLASATPWLNSAVTGDHLCLLQSGATNVSGVITLNDQ